MLKRLVAATFLIITCTIFYLAMTTPALATCRPINSQFPSCPGESKICNSTDSSGRKYCCDQETECPSNTSASVNAQMLKVCDFAGDKKSKCEACFEKDPPEAWTAIGCIPTDPQAFLTKFLNLGIGLAGGIAFLLILFGGLSIMTSSGNPEKLAAGKELVGSAIAGLLLIIFSLFLLQLIGYNILGIPGFG